MHSQSTNTGMSPSRAQAPAGDVIGSCKVDPKMSSSSAGVTQCKGVAILCLRLPVSELTARVVCPLYRVDGLVA